MTGPSHPIDNGIYLKLGECRRYLSGGNSLLHVAQPHPECLKIGRYLVAGASYSLILTDFLIMVKGAFS